MKTPLVSVIIPTYNRPQMLEEAIITVQAQIYKNFEIIVVNDGNENVEDIVMRFNKGEITYVRHPTNKGLGAARNTGIRLSKGKYIAYLDDDDLYYPDHLETLVTFLEKSHFKVAYTDAYKAYQENKNGIYVTTHHEIFSSQDFDNDYILVNNIAPILCFMHEKFCLDEIGLFDESLTTLEDWDLWIRMSRKFKIAHIEKTTCEVSLRHAETTQMTTSKRTDFYHSRKIIFDRYKTYAQGKSQIIEEQKKILEFEESEVVVATPYRVFALWGTGNIYVQKNQFAEAEDKYKEALSLEPMSGNTKANILISLGNVYYQQGKFSEAEEELKKALSLEPFNKDLVISVHYAMGSNYERQGRLNEAIEKFEHVVNDESSSIKFSGGAHFHLGCIYKELGKEKEAKQHFEECLKVIPTHKKAKEYLEVLNDE